MAALNHYTLWFTANYEDFSTLSSSTFTVF